MPTPFQKFLLTDLVGYAADCYQRHWNAGTAGNFSVRGTGNLLWQSPSGRAKGRLKPQDFIPVSMDNLKPVGPCSSKPSDETPLHGAIYRRFASAKTVIHVHPPFLVGASLGRQQLVFRGHEMAKALGVPGHRDRLVLPIVENSQNMNELSDEFAEMDLPASLLILKGHGVYSWGRDGYSALAVLEALEFLCQTNYHA